MPILTLALSLPLQVPAAFAAPDIQGDCRQLAQRDRVPPEHQARYMQFCAQFTQKCYDLENRAAASCAVNGTTERTGAAAMQQSAGQVRRDGTDYQAGTTRGIANVDAMAALRARQMEACRRDQQECANKNESLIHGGQTWRLACTTFTPENTAWSTEAARASNICNAIREEMGRGFRDNRDAQRQGQDLREIQGGTGLTPPPGGNNGGVGGR